MAATRCCGTPSAARIAVTLAIAEFLQPDATIERLMFTRADSAEIERAAVANGMITMFDAGLAAALDGTTTIEEVVRSIRAEA